MSIAYIEQFETARVLNRHHAFYLGPTNSGKTHEALNALINAQSGVYLAPLRLLAMEVRDRLMAAGVPCNLLTGEERTFVANARHTASTIEMMNPNKIVDVAVIDEIQMLQDPDRGSAWTSALVGVPAKQVFSCGSTAVIQPCIKVIKAMQESYSITTLCRKTPLVMEENSLCGHKYSKPKLRKQLQTGDAFIAFSRKDVLTYAARFRQWGYQVATIYGALSPEVRRRESARFCNAEATILVATDAIGMGLNLPIRRVIFCNIHKFDGVASRHLNATEVRQIAGRAGRYGIYDTGYVNVLEDDEQIHIHHMLDTDDTSDMQQLPIEIRFSNLTELALKRHTNKLSQLFLELSESQSKTDDYFAPRNLTIQIFQAKLIDDHAPNMSLKDKYIFACAPISLNVNIEKDYFLLCLSSVYNNQIRTLPITPKWLHSGNAEHLDKAEQLSQNISLYAWLSFKFPSIFTDGDQVSVLRNQVNIYISQALRLHRGFGEVSREYDRLKHR